MEAIHSPFSALSIPSSLNKHSNQKHQQRTHMLSLKYQSHPMNSRSQHRTRAFNDATNIAAAATAAPHRGDISVLLPISAVLLFMYWIANFVVPEIVSKDLQKKASEGEGKPEVEKTYSEESAASEPRRMKKADLKKMIKTKMDRRV